MKTRNERTNETNEKVTLKLKHWKIIIKEVIELNEESIKRIKKEKRFLKLQNKQAEKRNQQT